MNRLLSCAVAKATVFWLATLLASLVDCTRVSAQSVNIDYTGRGWYTDIGSHAARNLNYFIGDKCDASPCMSDTRNFFVFDLSGVTLPISSAKLALFVPGPLPILGFESVDPSETYELHDVTTSITTLLAGWTNGSSTGIAIWNDLGTGVVYGSRAMTAADMGSVVEITLNSSAIAAMNATHGLFAFGGSITTLDALPNHENIFAGTSSGSLTTQLRLTLVPEPSTLLLLGISAISLLGYRKAKS